MINSNRKINQLSNGNIRICVSTLLRTSQELASLITVVSKSEIDLKYRIIIKTSKQTKSAERCTLQGACRNCIYWVVYRNANLCWCFADDHHPPPTFTPPELPKKVHVRGTSQPLWGWVFYFIFFVLNYHRPNPIRRPAICFVPGYRELPCT